MDHNNFAATLYQTLPTKQNPASASSTKVSAPTDIDATSFTSTKPLRIHLHCTTPSRIFQRLPCRKEEQIAVCCQKWEGVEENDIYFLAVVLFDFSA